MGDEGKKKLKEIDDKLEAETNEIIKRLEGRNYWVFHSSAVRAIVYGLLCGLFFQGMAKESWLYIFIFYFVLGFCATRPKIIIESSGDKTSRVLQILAIGWMLFIMYGKSMEWGWW